MGTLVVEKYVQLEFEVFGNGEKPLLCFHGFNRSPWDYRVFEKELGSIYTFYSFYLFFYGESRVIEKDSITKKEFRELLLKFLDEQKIEKFSVMGFSLGGRLALMLTELFPERIEEVFLLAPDGLKKNSWHHQGLSSIAGRRLFKYLVESPVFFFKIASVLKKRKLIPESLYNFALFHMENEEKRKKVYNVWMAMRKLIPDLKKIFQAAKEYALQIHIIFGKYDKVIPHKILVPLPEHLQGKIVKHIWNSGHFLLNEKGAREIKKILHENK